MLFQLQCCFCNNCLIVKFASWGFTEANQARLGLGLGFRVRGRIRVTGFRDRVRVRVCVRLRVRVWSISGFSATGNGVVLLFGLLVTSLVLCVG